MRSFGYLAAGALATSSTVACAQATELLLTCEGSTVANVTTSQTVARASDSSGASAEGSASTSQPMRVPFTVQFRLENGLPSMHIPASAVQGAQGNAGWFPVTDFVATDSEFAGKVRLGFLYGSSRFRIDRRTGQITTSGGFEGSCRKEEIGAAKF